MKRVALLILDGWGIAQDKSVSAVDLANTPNMDKLLQEYPNATLSTSGLDVGLPEGQMGNSEVGHMNLGAGRVVYQNLAKINVAIKNNTFSKEKELQKTLTYVKENNKKLHLIGLVSDGGVHSHINHLKALIDATQEFELPQVYIHAFTDGRDCDPKSGKGFIQEIVDYTSNRTAKLASVVGRYYAMDRDKRWERVNEAYQVMVNAVGIKTENPVQEIENSYSQDITDEFIKPVVVTENGNPIAKIENGDVVICFNFRTDRGREITEVLSQKDFTEFGMKKLDLYYVTMTEYDETFQNVEVIYREDLLTKTLGEVLESNNKSQIRIAETEKYPHVTFFFSGGNEKEYNGERRILCQSPKDVATYDLKPEMAAYDIKNAIVKEMNENPADFICLNFANADMVGHTGSIEAAIKACETVDTCVGEVVEAGLNNGYTLFIIADHGNSDLMINPDGTPNTQHTTNPVPFIVVDKNIKFLVSDGKLGDIAPSILSVLGLEIPEEMTGNVIVK
jgi:2,3-bisphosphoglycerate-independent phosphoglycerate mutase